MSAATVNLFNLIMSNEELSQSDKDLLPKISECVDKATRNMGSRGMLPGDIIFIHIELAIQHCSQIESSALKKAVIQELNKILIALIKADIDISRILPTYARWVENAANLVHEDSQVAQEYIELASQIYVEFYRHRENNDKNNTIIPPLTTHYLDLFKKNLEKAAEKLAEEKKKPYREQQKVLQQLAELEKFVGRSRTISHIQSVYQALKDRNLKQAKESLREAMNCVADIPDERERKRLLEILNPLFEKLFEDRQNAPIALNDHMSKKVSAYIQAAFDAIKNENLDQAEQYYKDATMVVAFVKTEIKRKEYEKILHGIFLILSEESTKKAEYEKTVQFSDQPESKAEKEKRIIAYIKNAKWLMNDVDKLKYSSYGDRELNDIIENIENLLLNLDEIIQAHHSTTEGEKTSARVNNSDTIKRLGVIKGQLDEKLEDMLKLKKLGEKTATSNINSSNQGIELQQKATDNYIIISELSMSNQRKNNSSSQEDEERQGACDIYKLVEPLLKRIEKAIADKDFVQAKIDIGNATKLLSSLENSNQKDKCYSKLQCFLQEISNEEKYAAIPDLIRSSESAIAAGKFIAAARDINHAALFLKIDDSEGHRKRLSKLAITMINQLMVEISNSAAVWDIESATSSYNEAKQLCLLIDDLELKQIYEDALKKKNLSLEKVESDLKSEKEKQPSAPRIPLTSSSSMFGNGPSPSPFNSLMDFGSSLFGKRHGK